MNSPFDNFIQEMLGNRNPQGNMLTGVSTAPNFYNQAQNNDYYNNPFRRQDSIDAAMAKKLADEQALAQQLGLLNAGGMMSGGGGGGDSEVSLTPDQIAYFDAETDMESGARMNNIFSGIAAPLAGLLGGPLGYGLGSLVPNSAPVYSGRDNYSTRSPAAIQQQIQAEQAQAVVNAQATAMPIDPNIQAAIAANAQASNVAEGGGGYSGPGGVGGSGVSVGGGNAAHGFGIGGW